MITIKKACKTKNIKENQLVLDLETTGLDRQGDFLVVLGLLIREGEDSYTLQYFAENDLEEERLLKIFLNRAKDKEIITYNGNKFDLPFLQERLDNYQMPIFFPNSSLDLFDLIRSYRNFFAFESMKLVNMEKLIGIKRSDPSRYGAISKLKDKDKKRENPRPILIHNENDLRSTEALINIGEVFDNELSRQILDFSVCLKSVYINNNLCEIDLKASKDLNSSYFVGDFYNLKIKKREVKISLNVIYGKIAKDARGFVTLNTFGLKNFGHYSVDPNLLTIREERIYIYKNILSIAVSILEENLKT